jgi:hypothetical protein
MLLAQHYQVIWNVIGTTLSSHMECDWHNTFESYKCDWQNISESYCDTTIGDQVCQWLTSDLWFSLGTPVSSTNKTDRHDTTEILLKVALNTINHHQPII